MSDTDKANFLGHYGNLIDGWIFRWKRAFAESRTGTYGADRLAGDVMASYADGVEWCMYPWDLVAGRPQLPTVLITIAPAETSALQFASIADPGSGTLALQDLTSTQPGKATIVVNTNYTAALASDRRSVIVTLKDLDKLTPRLQDGDRFEAEISFGMKNDVIAKVLLLVKA